MKQPTVWMLVAGLIAAAIVTMAIGLARWGALDDRWRWLLILLVLIVFLTVLGRVVTGAWRGIVMNDRNLVSLSRFQTLFWSLLVLSMFLALSFAKMRADGAVRIASIPEETLALLGGAGVTTVFANGILSGKANKRLDATEQDAAGIAYFERYKEQYLQIHDDDEAAAKDEAKSECSHLLLRNTNASDARFRDMFEGDQTGDGHTIDFAKVQLFFFTLVMAITFIAAFWVSFDEGPSGDEGADIGMGLPTDLPALPISTVGALALSQSGYVASKAPDRRPTL